MLNSDSDDDNLDLLREAADAQFINDSMFNGITKDTNRTASAVKPASLRLRRLNCDDNSEQFNWLRVTPEFQKHIGKKLAKLLDDEIVYNEDNTEVPRKKQKHKTKVRLFKDSTCCIHINSKSEMTTQKSIVKRKKIERRLVNDDPDNGISEGEDSFKQIVISGEDILSEKETKHWSTRSKAPIFNYRKNNNGQLVYIEPPFI